MLFCKKNAHDEKFYWTSCFLLIINVFVVDARVAQLVEQRTENPRVGGSIPSPSTISKALNFKVFLCSVPIELRFERFFRLIKNMQPDFPITIEIFPRHIGGKISSLNIDDALDNLYKTFWKFIDR